ncbi:MAG: hypothetical protein ACJARS_005008 [bacterium]|jgi:hypothetical protein
MSSWSRINERLDRLAAADGSARPLRVLGCRAYTGELVRPRRGDFGVPQSFSRQLISTVRSCQLAKADEPHVDG